MKKRFNVSTFVLTFLLGLTLSNQGFFTSNNVSEVQISEKENHTDNLQAKKNVEENSASPEQQDSQNAEPQDTENIAELKKRMKEDEATIIHLNVKVPKVKRESASVHNWDKDEDLDELLDGLAREFDRNSKKKQR